VALALHQDDVVEMQGAELPDAQPGVAQQQEDGVVAFVALALGALRLLLPVAAYLSEGGWARGYVETPLPAFVGLFLSLPLWLITLLVFGGFAFRVRRQRGVSAGAP